jgi:hypothetical protein
MNSSQVDTLKQEALTQPKVGLWIISSSSGTGIVEVVASDLRDEGNAVCVKKVNADMSGWDRVTNKLGDLFFVHKKYFIAPYSSLMLELI